MKTQYPPEQRMVLDITQGGETPENMKDSSRVRRLIHEAQAVCPLEITEEALRKKTEL